MSSCNQSSSFHSFISPPQSTTVLYKVFSEKAAFSLLSLFSFSNLHVVRRLEGEKRKEEERNNPNGTEVRVVRRHFLRRFFVVVGPSLLTFFGRRWKGKKVLEEEKKAKKKKRVIYGFTACHHEVFFSTLSQDACDLERVQGVHEQWIAFGYHDQGAR